MTHSLRRIAIDRWIFLSALVLCAVALVMGSSPANAQTQVSNTARIGLSSGIADSNPANDESSAVVNITPLPVVTYTKSVNAPGSAVSVGDTLTYTLTATVSNSATLNVLTLTDTLGPGLDFGTVTSAGPFNCNAANPLICTLPVGTAVGTYGLTYTATVNATADTFVSNAVVGTGGDNPTCAGTCDTDTPVAGPVVTFAKTTSATSVVVGDTISYTLSATVANSQTTGVVTLTDTLGTGLDFGAVVGAGAFTCNAANPLVCTLPAGTAPGTYSLTYTATVNASATGSVTNAVIGSGPDNPSCPTNCGTNTPVGAPAVTYGKSVSAPGATVSAGDVLTYALTATVANSQTTAVLTLTDTMSAGLDFTAVTNAGAFSCNAANPLVCTLPAGTAPGTYSLTYTATVNASATGTVNNAVVGTGGNNPTCSGTCTTTTPVAAPVVTYAKSANATQVKVGDVISYTLTATVANSATTGVLTLTDTLGTGLDFTAVTNAGAFTCNAANPLVCALPAGTAAGTYSLTYTATVNASATGTVSNAVLGSGPDNPACGADCDIDTPVIAPAVSYSKTADTAGPVSTGDVITFTLTTTVANSQTTSDIVLLTDTLGTGLDFVSVVNAGAYTVDASGAPIVRFRLPAGSGPGTYSVVYTARVSAAATGTVSNVVVGSGSDNPTCTTQCGTTTPVADSSVTYSKSVSAPGATVSAGDVLTYTLTARVTNSPTTAVLTLTDTMSAGLDFTAVTNAGAFTCNATNPLVCTLPAGTAVGTYNLTYTATVNATATGSVNNAVVGTGGDNPACTGTCTTTTPVAAPVVTYTKSANATQVRVGDIISYTLTATVANSATTGVLTLTDTLGTGLDFTAVTNAGAFTCNAANPLVCTLPAGTAVGTYSLTYTAKVNASATGTVRNAVLGSGPDNPSCTTNCGTDTPVVAPAVTYAKTSSTRGPVSAGDVITFTLTTTVANSQTTSDIVLLTDTLGTGLDFTGVVSAGAYTVDASGAPIVRFRLPAGTGPGTYNVVYTATVNASATGSVSNVVIGSGADNPTCTTQCGTDTPVENSAVTYAKSTSATQVKVGDVISYTLTATVANSATTGVVTLTDTLGTGLDFTAVTSTGIFSCNAANPLVCTLPAGTVPGTYSLTYTATVNASATGTVTNAVLGSGPDNPSCVGSCGTNTPVIAPAVSYAKTANTAGPVSTGDLITFTLTTTVANSQTTSDIVLLTDTLGTGLDFVSVVNAGAYTVDASGAPIVRFRLPAGSGPGTYSAVYTARVNAAATGTVSNVVVGSGADNPTCTTQCGTTTPVADPAVTYAKSVAAPGTAVHVGDILTYTLTATVANSPTRAVLTLTDTLGAGLDFTAVTSAGAFTCNAVNPLVCTLPAGAAVGTYNLTYTATVNASATGSVNNAVVGSGGDTPTCAGSCSTNTPVENPTVTYAKAVTAPAATVKVGDVLTYTLSATVANSPTTAVLTLTDTLGAGLDFTAVTNAGAFTCNAASPLVCTLPAGTAIGTYSLTYTATVNASAAGSVTNAVVGTGNDNPTCAGSCGTDTPLAAPAVTYAKSVAGPAEVKAGDLLTYTLTATVTNSATAHILTLTDTLGTGLDFTAVTNAGVFTCNAANPLVCTLPAGTVPGAYSLTYTATVNVQASGSVRNTVVGTGDDTPTCADNCSTDTPVAAPVISVVKSADPAAGETVQVGQTINYSLVATVANGATTQPLTLVDTPDPGLTIVSMPANCAATGETITCTLPAGTPVGTHSLTYTATVNDRAGEMVRNLVTAAGGGGTSVPSCDACSTEHKVELPLIRLVKTAAVREVKIGDLVRYTLSVENVGERDLVNGNIVDMPPAGFTYVEGSLAVVDGDNAATVSGQSPLRFGGIDVKAGETATLAYLMRVGAGVRQGTHTNQAQVYSDQNVPVSNPATAQVELVADPLVDESLVFGTVFDDRDGDGWQDSAALSGLHVQGGFAPEVYVAGSTTVDRGDGMKPEADASAPLLHGIELGSIRARQSQADPVENHRIVIRQRLTAPTFTDDFVLTNGQGVTVRMNAAGETRIEKSGDAAKGLNGAEPRVARQVSQGEGGYVVDYIVENAGIDERGIPGVRVASVEGLIMETDQYGRYHLEGVPGGQWQRGRNFILKVDPTTLPDGAGFTTDNPLLRRITPGVPVRFDWGVKLPVALIEGRTETVELELGRVIFAPGSAEVREQYLPVIERMAAKVNEYQGGEVVIDANGDTEALAFDRAEAVKASLTPRLDPASARNLVITARGMVDDPSSMVVGIDEGGALLGTVLFDTDKSDIRPEFGPLLDKVAAWIAKQGGGIIAIVGHTDVRASFEYNTALGMRRARAVYDAIAERIPPGIRAKFRVESSNDPTASVGEQKK